MAIVTRQDQPLNGGDPARIIDQLFSRHSNLSLATCPCLPRLSTNNSTRLGPLHRLTPTKGIIAYRQDFHKHRNDEDFSSSKMSGYYFPPLPSEEGEDEFDYSQAFQVPSYEHHQTYDSYDLQPPVSLAEQQPSYYNQPQQPDQQLTQFQQPFDPWTSIRQAWTPVVPSNGPPQQPSMSPFPQYLELDSFGHDLEMPTPVPTASSSRLLFPEHVERPRTSRATSLASMISSTQSVSFSDASRSASPNASEMAKWVRYCPL